MIENHKISEIVKDHYNYFLTKDDKYFWSISLWWSLKTWEDKSKYLIAIINNAPITDLNYLGRIGAGELGDLRDIHILEFISELRENNISRSSDFDKKLCIALQIFRMQPYGEPLTEAELKIIKYRSYAVEIITC